MSRSFFALLLFLPFLIQCSTYSSRIREPRQLYEMGHYDRASELLEKLAEDEGHDQLLYLMDLGMVYHSAGRYEDAIRVFLKADKIAEVKDYTSLSAEAVAVLLNDDVTHYRGEDFEKILINTYLAMDFTLLGQWESALVECRKVNHKIGLMISQGKLPYKYNAFAKYLAAALFEARGEYNDAFVDYRQLFKWKGKLPFLGAPLLRMADVLRADQELGQYQKEFPKVKQYRLKRNEGEILVLLEVGKAPIKVPHPNFRVLPKFRKRGFLAGRGRVHVSGKQVNAQTLFDIEDTAIRQLDHRIAGITAKKIAGIVAKQVVARQVAKKTKSQLAGFMTSVLLHATDKADLRSWAMLPARLQLARMTVPAGRHDVRLDSVGPSGGVQKGVQQWKQVEVKPGQRVFLSYRLRS